MKNGKKALGLMLTAIMISGCAQMPQSVKDNALKTGKTAETMVAPEHILDGFDKVFEQKYSKFTLPDKNTVHIEQPEGAYNLVLEYTNKDKSIKWAEEKSAQILNTFNKDKNVKIINKDDYVFDFGEWSIDLFGNIKYSLFGDENYDVNDYFCDMATDVEGVYINRIDNIKDAAFKMDNGKFNIEKAAANCKEMSDKIDKITGNNLKNKVKNAFAFKTQTDNIAYEINIQKFYKNVGFLDINTRFNPLGLDPLSDDYFIHDLKDTFTLASDDNIISMFSSFDSYNIIESEELKKVYSLQGAVNKLENELANNIQLEFDDIEFMYFNISQVQDLSDENVQPYDALDGSKVTKCNPAWFFVIDLDEIRDADLHPRGYVMVDAVTGKITFNMP